MKRERRILIAIFTLVFILAAASVYFQKQSSEKGKNELSPFARSFDLFSFFQKKEKPKYIIYGYLPYWSIEKAQYLQYDKLTDIAYFGLYINADGTFKEKTDDGDLEPGYDMWKNSEELNKIIQEAQKNNVRVALTVISHVDETSDKFLDCTPCWETLTKNIKKELSSKGITDVNLNFEYYEYTDEDKAKKYAQFTKYLNNELDKTFGNSFVVVSTFADSIIKPRVTSEIGELGKNADGIFIMAYDFHRPASETAGPVSPLKGEGANSDYDLEKMINDYLTQAPPNKLIVGIPYYGYNWVIEKEEEFGKRKISANEDELKAESQTYEGIMETILETKPEVKWNDSAKCPYFTYVSPDTGELRQAYFDNAESLRYKYDFFKQKNLAGIGIWALGYDGGYKELWDLLYNEFVR